MSVYTTIERDELEAFLTSYDVGELNDYHGISDGIENTNYFVNTTKNGVEQSFVLTIFEHHNFQEMQYYLNLMHHLADHQVPSANPVADKEGHYLRMFADKPIALVERLAGGSIHETSVPICEQIGAALGKMHAASSSFDEHQTNSRGPLWFVETANSLQEKLPADELEMLNEEIRFQQTHRNANLPRGTVHADLFRDNSLWHTDQDNNIILSGIIDFYYACDDAMLYDLAVTANDWCINEDFSLDKDKVQAFLNGYHQHRPLEAIEQEYWPVMLRTGALRFWLSRLYDKHFPRPGELVHIKDPDVFKTTLADRITNNDTYQSYWHS